MKKNATKCVRNSARYAAIAQMSAFYCQKTPRVGLEFLNPRVFPRTIEPYRHYLHQTGEALQHRSQVITPLVADTIYAVSTAPGRAGIAIIRISGPACLDVYRAICPSKPNPKPRYATLRTLYDPTPNQSPIVLDSDALVLYFSAPNTVTGESMLELQIHGGPATVKAVLAAIPKCSPPSSPSIIRYAEPGEFTRRAFQNNRLDLAQVEALSDTLSAETEQQRRAAVRGNSGALGRTYESWRNQLLEGRGEMEALIDFSEDHDFSETDPDLLRNVTEAAKGIKEGIKVHREGGRRGEMLRRGVRISMLGPPNAGKSSLLNRIVGREASIVSDERGTTRDIVEVSLDMEGYLCTFADTAGLRSARGANMGERVVIGKVEEEGIRRAKAKAAESDLVIVMTSLEPSHSGSGESTIQYDAESLEIAKKAEQYVIVINKIDTVPVAFLTTALSKFKTQNPSISDAKIIPISCALDMVEEGNIPALISHLSSSFKSLTTLGDEDLYGVTERQRQLLETCDVHLRRYLDEVEGADMASLNFDMVVAAEELRAAGSCLGKLTGRGGGSDVEEVLGVVFEKFCVGK